LPTRLRTHGGTVWVRRLRKPLSAEQSRRLTDFAVEQTAKHYALRRVLLEATPFKAHGPVRSHLFGSARLDRRGWFCSELTVAAGAVVGLFDPQVMKPNTVYPRDLFTDHPHDISQRWEEPAPWTWDAREPPAPAAP